MWICEWCTILSNKHRPIQLLSLDRRMCVCVCECLNVRYNIVCILYAGFLPVFAPFTSGRSCISRLVCYCLVVPNVRLSAFNMTMHAHLFLFIYNYQLFHLKMVFLFIFKLPFQWKRFVFARSLSLSPFLSSSPFLLFPTHQISGE